MNGSFSYWPGGNSAHLWGSTYAAHFMTLAKKRGYSVPDTMYKPLINWLADSTQSYGAYSGSSDDSIETQVYRLYVLALAGFADIGSMNRIRENVQSDASKLLLATSYVLAGGKDNQKELVKNLKFDNSYYRNVNSITFSSSLRNQSIALMAYTAIGDSVMAGKYAKSISEILNDNKWLSTQETAWALFTLLPFYDSQKTDKASFAITNGTQKIDGVIENKTAIVDLNPAPNSTQTVTISNNTKQVLYGTLSTSGKSIPGTEVLKNDGLNLSVNYNGLRIRDVEKDGLKKGTTFVLEISVSNRTDKELKNVAVTIPANDRLTSENDSSSNFTYQDIRDDNIYTYLDLQRGETKRFTFNITVAYDGSYFIPAISAEAMYDNSISAINPGIYVKN